MRIPARLQPFLFASLACVVLAAFAGYDLLRERDRSIAQARTNTANLARLLEAHIRQSLLRADALLDDVRAQTNALKQNATGARSAARLEAELRALLPGDGFLDALALLDAQGQPRVAAASAGSTSRFDADLLRDWLPRLNAATASGLVVGKPRRNAGGRWQLPVGQRLRSGDGSAAGALLALVDLKTLQPVLDAIDTGKNGFVTLFLSDGWMIATAPHNDTLFERHWFETPMFKEHLPRATTGTVQQVVVRDGTERLYSYRALADFPVVVSTGISMTDALADWRARTRWNALLLALIAGASFWGAAVMSRSYVLRETAERDVAETARRTQAIVDHAADGIVTFAGDGRIESSNRAAAAMFGHAPAALSGQPMSLLLPDQQDGDAALAGRFEGMGRRADGSQFPVDVAVTELPRAAAPLRIALIRDISESRRAQQAVAQARDAAERSETFLRAVTDNLPLRIAYVDRALRYQFVNKAQCDRFDLHRDSILGQTRQQLTGLAVSAELQARIDDVLRGEPQRFETEEPGADGTRVIETYLVPDIGADGQGRGFYTASSDVTERHAQRRRIEQALAERETLLREVYHRVKNNLQVIQSLLNLQRRALPEGQARAALDDSVQRVHAMALVHEKLYQTGDLDAVSLHGYVVDLLRHLGDTAGAARRGIVLAADVAAVNASLEVAVPFGLLVTELVGNSFKHGFPDGRTGTIRVTVARDATGAVWLRVEDDGIGLAAGFDLDNSPSMGLQLASSLAGQLGGRLQASNDGGTCFSVQLKRME